MDQAQLLAGTLDLLILKPVSLGLPHSYLATGMTAAVGAQPGEV